MIDYIVLVVADYIDFGEAFVVDYIVLEVDYNILEKFVDYIDSVVVVDYNNLEKSFVDHIVDYKKDHIDFEDIVDYIMVVDLVDLYKDLGFDLVIDYNYLEVVDNFDLESIVDYIDFVEAVVHMIGHTYYY